MNIRGSYTDLIKIFQELDSIPVIDHGYFIDQYEEYVFRHGNEFFIDSHYQYRYTRSLFALEHHIKFLKESELALSFLLNYEEWQGFGKENYKKLLYDMATSLIFLKEYKKSKLLREQLVDLNYPHKEIKQLKSKVLKQKVSPLISFISNRYLLYPLVGVILVLLSFAVIKLLFY